MCRLDTPQRDIVSQRQEKGEGEHADDQVESVEEKENEDRVEAEEKVE